MERCSAQTMSEIIVYLGRLKNTSGKVGYINDSAREKLLMGPFYKNPFEIIPINRDCFSETVVINYLDKQLVTTPDWKINYYAAPHAMRTIYRLNGQEFSVGGHHCYQSINKQ